MTSEKRMISATEVNELSEDDVQEMVAKLWASKIELYERMADAFPILRDTCTLTNALTGETYPPMKEACHE